MKTLEALTTELKEAVSRHQRLESGNTNAKEIKLKAAQRSIDRILGEIKTAAQRPITQRFMEMTGHA